MICDYKKLCEALSRRFGGQYTALVRLHPRTKDVLMNTIQAPYAFDVTDYPDIQMLMVVSDLGITDYSSWIYDFVLTRRPGFLYATDKSSYVQRTGFVYPMEATPFPISEDFETLLNNISEFDEAVYEAKVEDFLKDKVCVDDGHAAERVADWLDEQMG